MLSLTLQAITFEFLRISCGTNMCSPDLNWLLFGRSISEQAELGPAVPLTDSYQELLVNSNSSVSLNTIKWSLLGKALS